LCLQEKRAEALIIAQQSASLNAITRDVRSLIGEQEVSVNVIEAHVESTLKTTEKGVNDLVKAEDYLTSYRWKGLFAVLLVLTTIGVLLGVRFLTLTLTRNPHHFVLTQN
jgi:t-SNARE complex subunit (syntaxin)